MKFLLEGKKYHPYDVFSVRFDLDIGPVAINSQLFPIEKM